MRAIAHSLEFAPTPNSERNEKNRFREVLLKLWQDESGQDLVEYAFILVFIGLAGLATMKSFAQTLTLVLAGIGNKLTGNV